MHAHVVLAHAESQPFDAHLAATASATLETRGWTSSVSDLYRLDFDPCERAEHYRSTFDAARFDVQADQRHASAALTIPGCGRRGHRAARTR